MPMLNEINEIESLSKEQLESKYRAILVNYNMLVTQRKKDLDYINQLENKTIKENEPK